MSGEEDGDDGDSWSVSGRVNSSERPVGGAAGGVGGGDADSEASGKDGG